MNHLLKLILLAPILFAIGCSDDPVSNNGTFRGTNGFVVNGDSMSNVVVNADSAIATLTQQSTLSTTLVVLYGRLKNEPDILYLSVATWPPTPSTGSFNWVANSYWKAKSYLDFMNPSPKHYSDFGGKTVLTRIGEVGEMVDGSFEGTMSYFAAFRRSIIINGKFSAIRR